MKNKINLLMVIIFNLFAFVSVYGQNTSDLKIVRGKTDTVNTPVHFIVGVAKPNSQVFINDQSVKQYSTGSFGAELRLNEGANAIFVKVVTEGREYFENFSVYYKIISMLPISEISQDYFKKTVVTKEGAYLNYGAGQDRLGGAKINYIAAGIRMELLDSLNSLYKVRLSENNYAFIPKHFVASEPLGTKPPFSLTSSWSVTNAGSADRIRISLQSRQPYTMYRELEPNRLVVDIYGAACNSNWITQYLNLKSVDYVDFKQIAPDVFRVLIYLKDEYSWGYKVDYAGNSLDITIRHTPQPAYSGSLKGLLIGIDAGHGGPKSLGAVSPAGFEEKTQNLAMAYMLKEMLEKKGARVVLSRTDDSDISMQDRFITFDKANVDLMVSIHCNAGGNPLRPGGTSTYYKHIEYRELAKSILEKLVLLDVNNFGLIGNFNFSLNSPTNYPTVLVETLFMSSLPDEEKIISPQFQKDMMSKVVAGLETYLKKVKSSLKKDRD